jgi:hypothetical protein
MRSLLRKWALAGGVFAVVVAMSGCRNAQGPGAVVLQATLPAAGSAGGGGSALGAGEGTSPSPESDRADGTGTGGSGAADAGVSRDAGMGGTGGSMDGTGGAGGPDLSSTRQR